jgi:RNA polymerase sigma-32 factor
MEYRRWGIPVEDLVQQGNVGLLRAARKFDAAKECRLATYAAYWIRAEIREFVVRAYRVVRLGTTKGERRALRAYRRTGENNPEKLAAVSGLSVERVNQLLPLLERRETSLDLSVGEGSPMVDRMQSDGLDPEEATLQSENRTRAGRAVGEALAELSERERFIIEERMLRDEPTTLQELGVRLGVSKERVRQLEERAKGKLKLKLAPMRDAA